MKKYILLCIIFCTISLPAFATNIIITAKVGTQNSPPVVLSVNPTSDPRILGNGKYQNYTIYLRDDERDEVTYTITPDFGYVNPQNGIIYTGNYDSMSGAYIYFTYLAPSYAVPNERIILTLNDGTNIITKQLNLYIY